MHGKTVAELTNLSYRQLNYLVDNVDGLLSTPHESQGQPRDFRYRDVVLIRLASLLREDGFRIKQIVQAVGAVDQNWKDNTDPDGAGMLLYGGDGLFRWSLKSDLQLSVTDDGKEYGQPIEWCRNISSAIFTTSG